MCVKARGVFGLWYPFDVVAMGTLAKVLGQLANKSFFESESANILKTVKANKIEGSLSFCLDKTLKDGHDMKAFGLGTAATFSNRERYGRFTVSMHQVYSEMETQLSVAKSPAVRKLWQENEDILRRSCALKTDLRDLEKLGITVDMNHVSPGTSKYLKAIRRAGSEHQGAGLL